jgi:hypothetical protein
MSKHPQNIDKFEPYPEPEWFKEAERAIFYMGLWVLFTIALTAGVAGMFILNVL